ASAPASVAAVTLDGLLRNHPDAPFMIPAAVSSLAGNELSFVEKLVAAPEWSESRAGLADVFQALGSTIAQGAKADSLNRLLQIAQEGKAPKWQRLALWNGIRASGLRTVDALPA